MSPERASNAPGAELESAMMQIAEDQRSFALLAPAALRRNLFIADSAYFLKESCCE